MYMTSMYLTMFQHDLHFTLLTLEQCRRRRSGSSVCRVCQIIDGQVNCEQGDINRNKWTKQPAFFRHKPIVLYWLCQGVSISFFIFSIYGKMILVFFRINSSDY